MVVHAFNDVKFSKVAWLEIEFWKLIFVVANHACICLFMEYYGKHFMIYYCHGIHVVIVVLAIGTVLTVPVKSDFTFL